MRVFMLGWEFPPFISGGLGKACYGLTKAMSSLGTDIMFVLPRPVSTPFSTHVRLVSPRPGSPLASPTTEFRLDEFEHVTFRTIDSAMADPYNTPAGYQHQQGQPRTPGAGANFGASFGTGAPSTQTTVAEVTRTTRVVPVGPRPEYQVMNPGSAPDDAAPPTPPPGSAYAGDLFAEIQRYASLASEIA